jgi:hypothetical protein
MNKNYIFRRGDRPGDAGKLRAHYDSIFLPEKVGELAEVFHRSLPCMGSEHWLIVNDSVTDEIASACALIPWVWELEGVRLLAAEMGLVGTSSAHQKKGLMRSLAENFFKDMDEGGFDLGVIQGIPEFYSRFGFYYSIPLENHINIPLHAAAGFSGADFDIRKAVAGDIPFLIEQDELYRKNNSVSAYRDRLQWEYIFSAGGESEYASDIRIIDRNGRPMFFFKLMEHGFGSGLIVCDVSEYITYEGAGAMFRFLGEEATRRGKPYIRLNAHPETAAAKIAMEAGADIKPGWAWQVKIPSPEKFFSKLKPVYESRLALSPFRCRTGDFAVNIYSKSYLFRMDQGKIFSVEPFSGEIPCTFNVSEDLLPALTLGAHTWRELHAVRPEVYPSNAEAAMIADVLFPKKKSWIYLQY